MAYIIDANCFIQPKNDYYRFDVCPGYWDALIIGNASRLIYSISHVRKELCDGNDGLVDWARAQGDNFFLADDDALTANSNTQIVTWVTGRDFTPVAKTDFLDSTDLFVIGYAMAYNHTVVTHESLNLNRKNKVMIPVVCQQFDVPCIKVFGMLQSMGTRFVLP